MSLCKSEGLTEITIFNFPEGGHGDGTFVILKF